MAAGAAGSVSSEDPHAWPRASEPTSRTTVTGRRCTASVIACARAPDGHRRCQAPQGTRSADRLIGARAHARRPAGPGFEPVPRRAGSVFAPGTGQAAFIAGRKVGGAVERNRARRILRAAWSEVARGSQTDMTPFWWPIRGARTQDLVAEMTELLSEYPSRGAARRICGSPGHRSARSHRGDRLYRLTLAGWLGSQCRSIQAAASMPKRRSRSRRGRWRQPRDRRVLLPSVQRKRLDLPPRATYEHIIPTDKGTRNRDAIVLWQSCSTGSDPSWPGSTA